MNTLSIEAPIDKDFYASIELGTDPIIRPIMPELDSLRGLAIFMVILYHGLYWQVDLSPYHGILRLFLLTMWTGRFGVNLFFVLSGFLITGILIETRERPDYYRRFYIRRALRIIPVYLIVLSILAVVKYAPTSFILLSLVYISNLAPFFGVPLSYPVLWSLSVEEHFYCIWPALVRHGRNITIMISSAAIIIMSPLFRLAGYFIGVHHGYVRYVINDYTWNSLDGLACGALFCVVLREYKPTRKLLLNCSFYLFSVAIFMTVAGLPLGIISRKSPYGMALQVVPFHLIFTAMLCLSLLLGSSKWKAIVTSKVLQILGKISYGLYLIHLLVFNFYDHVMSTYLQVGANISPIISLFIRFVLCLGVSVGIAYLSRYYFEEKFLRLKNRLS